MLLLGGSALLLLLLHQNGIPVGLLEDLPAAAEVGRPDLPVGRRRPDAEDVTVQIGARPVRLVDDAHGRAPGLKLQ